MLPCDYLPRQMVIGVIKTVVFYINAFVWTKGVSSILPPLNIVKGCVLDYNLHFRVTHREFLQIYEGTKNDMVPRTVDAIAFGPNRNS